MTEIEKLVEIIYRKQTYAKDCDREIAKLNRLLYEKQKLSKMKPK